MSFDENWQAFLKAVYDTELVPAYALTAIQLGCGLLQLLAHAVSRQSLSVVAEHGQHPNACAMLNVRSA